MSAIHLGIERCRTRRAWCIVSLAVLVSCSPEPGGVIDGPVSCRPQGTESDVTVATYNMHSGMGRDGKRDLNRIADLLRDVDVVGLQEVDNGRIRSAFNNQAKTIAGALGHHYWQHFPAEDYWPFGAYGNAATSSLPVAATALIDLPRAEAKPMRRLAWIKLFADCRPLHVFILHLTRIQDQSVLSAQAETTWRVIAGVRGSTAEPAILMGDFNAVSGTPVIEWFRQRMVDVVKPGTPVVSGLPAVDHIFVTPELSVLRLDVRDLGGSDHPALVATLRWK
jgi:endonuclease/exonuclease/phosphatase family metal-dependent hydrolase